MHAHGPNAVFSILYNICSLKEALDNAAANVHMTVRNVTATIKLAQVL
ncbi:MAG: hypothetical protein ACSLEN_14805 [Candidatus Malihini olakiniferum]